MLPSIYFSAAYRVLLSLVVVFVLTSIDGLGHLADVSRKTFILGVPLLLVLNVFCQLELIDNIHSCLDCECKGIPSRTL